MVSSSSLFSFVVFVVAVAHYRTPIRTYKIVLTLHSIDDVADAIGQHLREAIRFYKGSKLGLL
jgi:hypothetical protein